MLTVVQTQLFSPPPWRHAHMIVFRMLRRTQRIGQFHWPRAKASCRPISRLNDTFCPLAWLRCLPPGVCFSPLVPLNARARALKALRQRRGGLILGLLTWSTDVGNLNRRSWTGGQSHLRRSGGTGSASFLAWRRLRQRCEAPRQEGSGVYLRRAPRLPGSVLVLPAVRRLWTLWRRRLYDPVYLRRLVSITASGKTRAGGRAVTYLSRAGF